MGGGRFGQGGGSLQLFAAGRILSGGQYRADPPLKQFGQVGGVLFGKRPGPRRRRRTAAPAPGARAKLMHRLRMVGSTPARDWAVRTNSTPSGGSSSQHAI